MVKRILIVGLIVWASVVTTILVMNATAQPVKAQVNQQWSYGIYITGGTGKNKLNNWIEYDATEQKKFTDLITQTPDMGLIDILTAVGAYGWEMTGINPQAPYTIYIFKRPGAPSS